MDVRRRDGHYTGSTRCRDNRASSSHTDPLLCFHSNPSTVLHVPTLPTPSSARSLTVAAVFAPEANRTEAGVGPPADRAGAAVLAGAGVTERVLGMAAWRYQSHPHKPRPAHHLPPAHMERDHCPPALSLAARGASPATHSLRTGPACSGMRVKAVIAPYARRKTLWSWTDSLASPRQASSADSALGIRGHSQNISWGGVWLI